MGNGETPMNSTFLSAFQPTIVANGVHHKLAFSCEIIGCHNEQAKYDAKKQNFGQPAALMQLQPVKRQRRHKQGGQKQDNTGITETVKRFEELHCCLPVLELELSMPLAAIKDKDNKEKIMSDIHIRPARVQDAAELARLDNVASHGLSEWYWRRAAVAEQTNPSSWLALSTAAMASAEFPPGWTNGIVAERSDEILGGASGVLTKNDGEKIGVLDEPLFEPIFQLFHQAAGDWLLDWLAVDEAAQGQGIGGRLLDSCMAKAKVSGASQASLVVEDSNAAALRLYHSRGFRQRDQRPYIPFNETSQTQNWLLLSAPVT